MLPIISNSLDCLYTSICTCPDILCVVSIVACHVTIPSEIYLNAVKHIFATYMIHPIISLFIRLRKNHMSELWMMNLVLFCFLSLLFFLTDFDFWFWFSLFFILDLDKEYDITLYMIVTPVTKKLHMSQSQSHNYMTQWKNIKGFRVVISLYIC